MMFDAAIVGAGLVGSSLALSLARLNLKILLIDQEAPRLEDARLFALNASSVAYLEHLELWQRIVHESTPMREVRVSRRGGFGITRLCADELGMRELGAMMPAKILEQSLHETVQRQASIDYWRPASLKALSGDVEGVELLVLQNGKELQIKARTVFGADGVHSTVRRLLGIEAAISKREEIALVARVNVGREHKGIAYERFNAPGVLAMLPLPNHQMAMIWSLEAAKAKDFLALSPSAFLKELQQAFGSRCGELKGLAAPLAFYPLKQVLAKCRHSEHVMLLGNAAHTLYPLAAQGFNLALYEVALIAEHIQDAMQDGTWPHIDLAKMCERMRPQQQASIAVSKRLAGFLQEGSLRSLTLSAGFLLMECMPWVRGRFMREMLSHAAYVPRSMRATRHLRLITSSRAKREIS